MARKKKKEVIDILEIESIGFNGVSIARKDEKVHFVKGGVPGDVLKTRRLRSKKSYSENLLLEVEKASENRIDPPCNYFDDCGGCSWQNMPYNYQLDWKKRHVEDAFFRQFKFEDIEIKEVLNSPQEFNYRNKMDFSFASSRWLRKGEIEKEDNISRKNFALGLHIPGRFDKVLDIENCLIADDINSNILEIFRETAFEYDITAFNRRHNIGFLRNLIIRSGENGKTLLINLVSNKIEEERQENYLKVVAEKLSNLDKVTGFLHSINSTKSPVKIEEINLIFGKDYIFQEILDIKFKISPFSFFQTNSFALDTFIGNILEIADLKNSETIWDLYCGTGSISLPASKKCKKVIGVELVESSIEDAISNANLNGIKNTEFYAEDLHKKEIPELLSSFDKPDKVIIDPPRAGMHRNLIDHLLRVKPKNIIYVSCNPMTQARDCDLLRDDYNIDLLQPFDMFPHTYHIENIALMTLIDL